MSHSCIQIISLELLLLRQCLHPFPLTFQGKYPIFYHFYYLLIQTLNFNFGALYQSLH